MAKLLIVAIVAVMLVAGVAMILSAPLGASVSAKAKKGSGSSQADHALYGPGDDAIFCGVKQNKAEGYTLHVSATAGGTGAGTLVINFRDGDAIAFNVPAGTSFSTTQELGGVPTVDDRVKITAPGSGVGVTSFMASVAVARAGAQDPFGADGAGDNFCLTSPGDPGSAAAAADFIVP